MTNDWILDVIADLQAFARKNGLSALERQLDVAAQVAVQELASGHIVAPVAAQGDVGHVGILHRATAGGPNA